MFKLSCLFCFLTILLWSPAYSQSQKLYFKHITSNQGLASNFVESIIQDHQGFMWFGTAEGLSRYDGYSFLNLSNSSSDTSCLINNDVRCLLEDKFKRLWIGTQMGITYLDLETYKFKRFSNKFKDNIGTGWIRALCLVDEKNLLISVDSKGLFCLDISNERLLSFTQSANHNGLINNTIRSICKDRSGSIWLATDGGLEKFDLKTGRFSHCLIGKPIGYVSLDNNGKIFASTINSTQIFTVDPQTLQTITIETLPEKTKEKTKRVYFDNLSNRWLHINDNGIYFRNFRDNTTTHYIYEKNSPNGINSSTPLTIFEDRNGNIWIGTYDAGVNLIERYHKPFLQIKNNNQSNGLQSNHVRSVFQDKAGTIWIGTKIEGMISKLDRKTLTFSHYRNDPKNPNTLNDEFVFSIVDADDDNLWIGTLSGGLNLFNKKTGLCRSIQHQAGSSNEISSNSIYALLNDRAGNIWIGNGEKGLDVYSMASKKFEHFENSTASTSLSNNSVRSLFKDSYGEIWVGTLLGLNLYDPKTKTFKRFLNDSQNPNSISDNNIICFCEDASRNLWIGTRNGFNLYNRDKKNFTVYNQKKGFPSQSARGILDDNDGNLWISTNNGIVRFTKRNETFKHYTKEDGFTSNEFASYSFFKTKNGEMIFGTDDGLVLFNPDQITNNIAVPSVVISELKIFNQTITNDSPDSPLKNDITHTREITLDYDQSVFTLGFLALNYTTSEKNQYAYKMEGVDKDWNYIGFQKNVTYTNLRAGKYLFKVKASNNDGVWNEQGASISITILPPPWKTWWAYCIYSILLALAFVKYRRLTIAKLSREKERELDQMKLNLFINISHEFRTPLTLMMNPIDKMMASNNIEEVRTSIGVVKRAAWKLLNLTNQLLDFRKLDLGQASLEPRAEEIVSTTAAIVSQFENFAGSKQISLSFECDMKQLETWIDADKYEKIISNLLSNAIKFTNPNGTIKVSMIKTEVKTKLGILNFKAAHSIYDYVDIKVCDSGIGINPDELKNIFNRFYQVDQSKVGTGIGLNFAKNLTELHGGELLVESEAGKGSTFTVRLPLGKDHLTAEQIERASNKRRSASKEMGSAATESLLYDIEDMDLFPEPGEEAANENAAERKLVVLIVEDNKALRKQIQEELQGMYTVKEAANGLEGIEKAQKFCPDLIISDIMMPKMDGVEMCKQLKNNIDTSHIPILLLTAKGSTENKIEGFEIGADEYMSKPFSIQLLKIRVKNLIQSRVQLKEKFSSSKSLGAAKEYTTNNLDEAFLEKITKIVLSDIDNPDFSLNDLCEKMSISSSNLFKKIQSITGLNPSAFVRNIRLKFAAEQLCLNIYSVKDVCFNSGFSSPAYFTKTFKELYGQTPKEYADSNKKGKETSLEDPPLADGND